VKILTEINLVRKVLQNKEMNRFLCFFALLVATASEYNYKFFHLLLFYLYSENLSVNFELSVLSQVERPKTSTN
jgi:hypothetical protein